MTQPTEKTLSWPMRHRVAVNLTPEDMGVVEAALNDCESKSDDDTVDALAQIILVLEIADITAADDARDVAYHIVHGLRRMI